MSTLATDDNFRSTSWLLQINWAKGPASTAGVRSSDVIGSFRNAPGAHPCASDSDGGDESNQEQHRLSSLIRDIFSAGDVDLRMTIETYFAIAHNWLPILNKEQLYSDTSYFLTVPGRQNDVLALLLLCIYIFIQEPRLFFLLQLSAHGSDIGLLHSGLLLAAYGLGHGLSRDAYGTLSVCMSFAQQLSQDASKLDGSEQGNESSYEITKLDLCWSGIILLDSTMKLSNFEYRIPQFVGLNRQLVGVAISEATDEDLYGEDLSRKFAARAQVALRIGKILNAITNSEPVQREEAETDLHKLVISLITRTQGKSFPLCETVAMSLRWPYERAPEGAAIYT
ncbi:casein kinase II subunit beta-2 [Fusarium pseudocircinatum]|uniref:Casein kinase II subunit beta-2 n=1 Tax=Fusarium pseudocircinatum TaxID=56676 RepID=A0A8H5KM37_9HYPO|nr:casein kinase II subunit beta-2 [Fusarium pseudocircinatum]